MKYKVTDTYVPSGTSTLTVSGGPKLTKGAKVAVIKSLTQGWAKAMPFPDEKGNTPNYWTSSSTKASTASAPGNDPDEILVWERTVASASATQIVLDAPISDNLDSKYGTAWVVKNDDAAGRIQNVGIVQLIGKAGSTYLKNPTKDPDGKENANYFLSIGNVQNAWASDLTLADFNTAVFLDYGARFITIQSVKFTSIVPWTGKGARPLDFATRGQQTLMKDCTSSVENTYSFVTKQHAPGPNCLPQDQGSSDVTSTAPHALGYWSAH